MLSDVFVGGGVVFEVLIFGYVFVFEDLGILFEVLWMGEEFVVGFLCDGKLMFDVCMVDF